jgi:hypothetical protein
MENGCHQSQFFFASSLDTQCRLPEVCHNGHKREVIFLAVFQDTQGTEDFPPSHNLHIGEGRKSQPPARLTYPNEAKPLLRSIFSTWCAGMKFATKNRLIKVYFAIPDLHIVSTIRTGTHPSLVVNRRPLTTKVGQRYQIPLAAFLTFWE